MNREVSNDKKISIARWHSRASAISTFPNSEMNRLRRRAHYWPDTMCTDTWVIHRWWIEHNSSYSPCIHRWRACLLIQPCTCSRRRVEMNVDGSIYIKYRKKERNHHHPQLAWKRYTFKTLVQRSDFLSRRLKDDFEWERPCVYWWCISISFVVIAVLLFSVESQLDSIVPVHRQRAYHHHYH